MRYGLELLEAALSGSLDDFYHTWVSTLLPTVLSTLPTVSAVSTRGCRLSRDIVPLVYLKPSVMTCSLYLDTCCLTSNLLLLSLFLDVDNLQSTSHQQTLKAISVSFLCLQALASDTSSAVAMPPKQFNTKASKVHSDSTYEDSEPESQPLRKPRITLKRGKSALNMNEIDVPIHSRTVTKKPSQDQIYKDLLSRPAVKSANEPSSDQIYKDLLSRPVVNEPATKRQRVSPASTSAMAIAAPASSPTIASKRYFTLTYKHLFQLKVC